MSLRILDLADPTLAAELQGRDLAISASAGSGKTFALVTLVLGFLGLADHRPHQVRAATFGKEAAADLRQRVLRPLDELASLRVEDWRASLAALDEGFEAWDGWVSSRGHRMEIAMAARQWMAQGRPAWMASPAEARARWTRVRREAELMEISTVHSLATAVLRERGVGARVLEAQDPLLLRLLRQAGREVLDRDAAEGDRPAARHLLAWAEGWHGSGDGWAQWAVDFDAHQDALGPWREETDTEDVREAFWREGEAVMEAYGPFAADPMRAAGRTAKGEPKALFMKSGLARMRPLPAGKDGAARLSALMSLMAFRSEKTGMALDYFSPEFAKAIEPAFEQLPALWEHWLTLLLERVFARYRELKRARDLRSYGDLARDAIALLEQEAGEGPDLLLVDEYQDINPGQERLLRLFHPKATVVVGDPKQAIYRFRGGQAALLEARLRDAGRGAFRLPANHRSAAPVVELANAFVSEVAPGLLEEDYDPEGRQDHRGAGAGEARVATAVFPSEKKRGADLPAATDWIAGLSRDGGWAAAGFAPMARGPRRRALLLAKRRGLATLRRALQNRGVEPLVQSNAGFWESPGVRLMMAALEAAGRPERSSPFAALLRSPLVGARDGELLALRAEIAKGLGGFEALTARLEQEADWLRSLRAASTQSLVARVLARPGLAALLRATEAHGALEPERARRNLDRFLDLVPALPRHPASAFGVLDQLRRARDPGDAPAEGASADLLIQTVHASKGLEYEDTILPLLNSGAKGMRPGALGRVGGRLASAWKFGAAPGPAYLDLRRQDREGRLRDALNLIYVGLTRAKDRLMVLVQGGEDGSPAQPKDGVEEHQIRWDHVGADLVSLGGSLGLLQPGGAPGLAPARVEETPALAAPSHGGLVAAPAEPIAADAEDLEQRRRQGLLAHALLREVLIRRAQDLAAAQACLDASPSLKGMAEAFLAALEKKSWLHLPRRTELPLEGAAASGATGFADLVIWEPDRADPAAIHIIDFKLADGFLESRLDEYRHQLGRYREALQGRHRGVPITTQLFALGSGNWVDL